MKQRILLSGLVIGMTCMASACIPVSYVQTGTKSYGPKPEGCPVQIYLSKTPEQYEELGLAETTGGDIEQRYEAVRKKACEVGGNGIIPKEENVSISSSPVTKYHTATTNSGGMMNYSTTSTQVSSVVTQKFIIIRTPE